MIQENLEANLQTQLKFINDEQAKYNQRSHFSSEETLARAAEFDSLFRVQQQVSEFDRTPNLLSVSTVRHFNAILANYQSACWLVNTLSAAQSEWLRSEMRVAKAGKLVSDIL